MKYFLLSLVLQFAFIVQPACLFAQFGGGGKVGNANKNITGIRKERLETHFAAFATWVDHYCKLTAGQMDQFNTAIKEEIAKAAESYGPPRRLVYRYDYWPIQLVNQQGAAWEIYHAGLEDRILKILNAEQKEIFQAVIAKRKQRLHEIFLERVIIKAGTELALSEKQQQQLKKIFPNHLPLLENGLYSFKPRNQYLDEKLILTILTQPPMAYRREQWEVIKLLGRNRVHRGNKERLIRIVLQSNMGPEGWRERINESAKMFQGELQMRLIKETAKHFPGNQLNPENARYLEVARKGAACNAANQWKKDSLLFTERYEKHIEQRPGMVFNFSVQGIDGSKIDQHPIWVNAVKKVKASLQGGGLAIPSEFTIKYAAAMLDQELWFTDDQLPKIRELYRDSHLANELIYRGEQYELYLLATIIYAKKESELKSLLNKEQLTAFKTLKNQYEIEDSFLRFFKRER